MQTLPPIYIKTGSDPYVGDLNKPANFHIEIGWVGATLQYT